MAQILVFMFRANFKRPYNLPGYKKKLLNVYSKVPWIKDCEKEHHLLSTTNFSIEEVLERFSCSKT